MSCHVGCYRNRKIQKLTNLFKIPINTLSYLYYSIILLLLCFMNSSIKNRKNKILRAATFFSIFQNNFSQLSL